MTAPHNLRYMTLAGYNQCVDNLNDFPHWIYYSAPGFSAGLQIASVLIRTFNSSTLALISSTQ